MRRVPPTLLRSSNGRPKSTLEEKAARGDWDGALKLIDAQAATRQIDRDAANRRRAVLLTAKAEDLFDSDPAAAKAAAVEANRLRPEFVPAAVAAARVLFKQDDIRKGAKILEAAWKAEPHPEIAELYTHARHGDAVHDRLKRARKLQSLKQNNVESALAVARAALDAQEFREAREAADAAIRLEPREGAYLLLADIEELETGDQGRVRQFLSKAVRAPRDPAWVADGYVSEHWAPISPVTGKLDAFEWKVPVERIGQLIEQDDAEPESQQAVACSSEGRSRPSKNHRNRKSSRPQKASGRPPPSHVNAPEADAKASSTDSKTVAGSTETSADVEIIDTQAEDETDKVSTGAVRLPDDPGVDPKDEQAKAQSRFRLF